MAGPTRAAGYADYSSAGNNKFTPEIWSGKLVDKFYKQTVFGEIANTDYEGEIQAQGDKVIIRTVPNLVINDYQIGQNSLNYQVPESNAVSLNVDKAKYFAFTCDDIDRHQSDLNLMDAWSNDGGQQMKIAIDSQILATAYTKAASANAGATAGLDSGNINLGTAAAPVALTKANIIDWLVDLATVLDEQNVPDENRWLVLPPRLCGLIRKSDLKDASITGDSTSMVRNGRLGEIDRFTIYKSNQVAKAAGKYNVMFGHKSALTFASQMTKMETLANPNSFGQLVRGLNVYGWEAIKPEALGHSVVTGS